MKYSKLVFVVLFLLFFKTINSQHIVKGIVKAADTQETIPFAYIKSENSKKLQATNESGEFTIKLSNNSEILSFSSIGYQSSQLSVSATDTNVIVYLEPASLNLGEVNVYASKSGMQASSLESLKNIETYSLAGTTKDIFRSVQMLPGVSSNNAASAQYNVRGGTYDENLMLINGIEVAEPYHIKIFPMASVGIFNIDMVQRIDFSSGGFSAEYGDALSSVMNVEYRKANNDSICGRVNLGMIDLGILAEIPLSRKASFLVAGRHSYLDPVIQMIDIEQKVSIKYYDVQAKFDYKFNNRHEISVLGIFSQDYDKVGPENDLQLNTFQGNFGTTPMTINQSSKSSYQLNSNYNDVLFAAFSKHNLGGKVLINSEFSFYHEKENTPQSETDSVTSTFSVPQLFYRSYYYWEYIKDYDLKTYEYKISSKFLLAPGHSLKIGAMARISEFEDINHRVRFWDIKNNTEKYPDTVQYILRPQDFEDNSVSVFSAEGFKTGGYLTYQWQLNSKLALNLGFRTDYFSLNKELSFSPRVNATYSLNDKWKINSAWGIFHKNPIMKQIKYDYASSDNTKNQQTTHYILGIERKSGDITFKTEAYYKKYDKLIGTRRNSQGAVYYEIKDNNAEGYAQGIDFEYIIAKPKFNIWFIYSLCSAKEKLNGTNTYYSRYTDQTHTISALFVLKMNNKKQLDAKITYGSGYTYQTRYFDKVQNQWVPFNPIQTASLPFYLSIDVRFKKDFRIKSSPVQFYVDIMNVLNRKNVIGHQYRQNFNNHYEEDFSFLGILPTFGVIVDF